MSIAGVGVDIVDAGRLERALSRTPALAGRIFTAAERRACTAKSRAVRSARLAARFAAKEAFYKALGKYQKGLGWKDLEVQGGAGSAPRARLSKKALAALKKAGGRRVHLTLSHDGGIAIAVVILEG